MISAGCRPGAGWPPGSGSLPRPLLPRSAASSFSLPHSRSASRREFANTIVDLCCSIRSSTRSSTCGQIERRGAGLSSSSPAPRPGIVSSSVMSSTGTTTRSSMRLGLGGCTTVTVRLPPRNVATSSAGRTVADRPTRWAGALALVRPFRRRVQAFQGKGQVSAALVARDGVHLVHDDRLDPAQGLPGLRGEQQEE